MTKSSLGVFDFDEEDNAAELIAAKYSGKIMDSEAHQNCAEGKSMQFKDRGNVARVDVDGTNIDNNSECAASSAFMNGEDCDVNMSDFDAMPLTVSCFAEELPQSRPIKVEPESSCGQMGGSSVSGIALPANTRFKCPRDVSSSDEFSDAAPGADRSLSETSPSTSSYIGDDDYGDDDEYISYRDKHLTDSVMIFSSSRITVRSSKPYVEEEIFEFQLGVDDIISVESHWCERFEMGMVKIHIISKGSVFAGDLNATSGVEELKFSIVGDWCGRQNAIISMDVYKPLWKTVLNSELNCNSELGDNGEVFSDRYFPNFDKAFEDLIYPKGDPDAVSISKRDIDLLQPDTFVNDTIIDFYIKYLKNKIEPCERHRFHFFNSFFFRKLADLDKNPSSAVEGRAAFQRVRKWTRKINLFEKDYLFVPVNFNYHWSLIVICYPGEAAESLGNSTSDFSDPDPHKALRVPCILHMDSIRGSHSGLKSLLQSYLCEEWKERQKDSSEDISSRFLNLRFLSLELPQQQNSYDCGLFLLHYAELFLEGVPVNFNPFQLTKFSNFLTANWFVPYEASLKRAFIQRMIYDLLDNGCSHGTSYGAGSRKEFTSNCLPSSFENGTTNGFIAARCSPSKAFYNNAMGSQTGQELELTLLPSVVKSPGCNRDSGLVDADPMESGDAVGSIYQSLEQAENSAPLNKFKNAMLQIEGEKEADGFCGSTAAAETGLERFVATTYQESNPFSSTEFKGEPSWNLRASVHQIVPDEVKSSLEKSVCVTDEALDVEMVNHDLEGTNLNFEVNVDQSRPPEDDEECVMVPVTSVPSRILENFYNSPDHIHYHESEDVNLVTTFPESMLGSSAPDFDAGEEGIMTRSQSFTDAELVTNALQGVVDHGLEGTNPNFEVNVVQSRPTEDKDLCLRSTPGRIPDIEGAELVINCPQNLLGSSAQDSDAGEDVEMCKGSQSFPDTDFATNKLHEAKRRKLISLEGRLPENLAGDLHL
ncbi:hypothetical protein DCAR_0418252 [Daucus carota subsp. sativus]|uniref:Ubiquitin-like protease family profile domain-containing protein n=1 Tax=Daucus carota subsp. sativus TaxID=79200 RepID=A0AAF0X1E3_DAUCS|nr:hypothetical protein DCAR_0418252 [Daucus carota subsp. sativus]